MAIDAQRLAGDRCTQIGTQIQDHLGDVLGIDEQAEGRLIGKRPVCTRCGAQVMAAATLKQISRKSELAGAIHYMLWRWCAFTRYRDNGNIEIDNNAAERSLRAFALSRKNYLFADSDAGGERAAAI